MLSYDETRAECWVYTFKEGLLSKVAHDLRLRVARFCVELDDEKTHVSARFDPSSIFVDTPMKDGKAYPSALSSADKQKIAEQIREEVLLVRRFPNVDFRSSALSARADGGYDVSGELSLRGTTRELRAQTRLVDGRQLLELSIHQPDYGIAPYRALFGTLKLQSEVKLRLVI